MLTIDLGTGQSRRDSSRMLPGELFRLGVALARSTPDVCVHVPFGPSPEDRIVLDGRLLSQEGVAFY
jgi:hypothetical protein